MSSKLSIIVFIDVIKYQENDIESKKSDGNDTWRELKAAS